VKSRWFALFLFLFSSVTAQHDPSYELKFFDHLLAGKLYRDAALQFDFLNKQELNTQQKDSLHYLLGWNLYERKMLDSSAVMLMHVSPASENYEKAQIFAAYNYIYTGKQDNGFRILDQIDKDSVNHRLVMIQKAGSALINNDLKTFPVYAAGFDSSFYATAREESNLLQYHRDLLSMKKRSPALAAGLSALLPGAGKVYGGKNAEGIITFFQVAALGLMAWENYDKAGVESARFIVSASVFGIFYVGNIWGSYFSVSIKKKQLKDEIRQAVLFNMQIPLRNIYR
jgi:hypothetical protein